MWARLVWFGLLCAGTSGFVYKYDNEKLLLGHLEYRRVGLFTTEDAPDRSGPSEGQSYIDVNVVMTRESNQGIGILQLIAVHSSVFDHVGFTDGDDKRHFCCTESVIEQGVAGCAAFQLGRAVIKQSEDAPIQVYNVEWENGQDVAMVSHRFGVKKSGRHYLMFSSCLESTHDVTMSGEIVWMNPYGYLPGELFHFIPLYRYLAMAYAGLGIIWVLLCLLYRDDLLRLQHYITVVVVLGLFESLAWYHDYSLFNAGGSRLLTPLVFGVLLSSLKRTLSRLLVLVVCMGHGLIVTHLAPEQRTKAVVMGLVYFVFSSLYEVISCYSQTNHILQQVRALALFPVAALDAIFVVLILSEISANIQLLAKRNQVFKLAVFRKFWQILVTACVFSAAWGAYQAYATVVQSEDEQWNTLWEFEAMWHAIYFAVLFAISVLWRPSPHALEYLESEQVGGGDEEDLGIEMSDKLNPAFTLDDEDEYEDDDY